MDAMCDHQIQVFKTDRMGLYDNNSIPPGKDLVYAERPAFGLPWVVSCDVDGIEDVTVDSANPDNPDWPRQHVIEAMKDMALKILGPNKALDPAIYGDFPGYSLQVPHGVPEMP
jgi:hypothetical protein